MHLCNELKGLGDGGGKGSGDVFRAIGVPRYSVVTFSLQRYLAHGGHVNNIISLRIEVVEGVGGLGRGEGEGVLVRDLLTARASLSRATKGGGGAEGGMLSLSLSLSRTLCMFLSLTPYISLTHSLHLSLSLHISLYPSLSPRKTSDGNGSSTATTTTTTKTATSTSSSTTTTTTNLYCGRAQAHEASKETLVQLAVLLESHGLDDGRKLVVVTDESHALQPAPEYGVEVLQKKIMRIIITTRGAGRKKKKHYKRPY